MGVGVNGVGGISLFCFLRFICYSLFFIVFFFIVFFFFVFLRFFLRCSLLSSFFFLFLLGQE